MSSKLKRRCLLWLAWGILGISISLAGYQTTVVAMQPVTSVVTKNVVELETQAKQYYLNNQFEQAIAFWQRANQIYAQSQDILAQARVKSNLALAYSKLNQPSQATDSISASLNLLESGVTSNQELVSAQVLNNWGIIQLHRGQTQQAIASWQQAEANYQQAGDTLGVIRAAINQANAYKQLGFYRRALNSLSRVEADLTQLPDSLIKATALKSYGDILHLVGEVERSQEILQASLQVASNLENSHQEAKTLIALGNTYRVINPDQALEIYNRSWEICQQNTNCLASDLLLQIYLAKFNLLIDTPQWQSASKLIASIQAELARLPQNKANIDRKINFAYGLLKLHHLSGQANIPDLSVIETFLAQTIQQARAINYQKALSYSWGLQGQVQEELQNWQQAQEYTQQALILAQRLNAADIVYLWQWQLGRINLALENRSQAISHYTRAVELVKTLGQDLVAIPNFQYSFRQGVEPIYRELVSLLLTTNSDKIPQANLKDAIKIIESLRLAELNNFFREACLDAEVVNIDSLDRQAAIVYPIILGDRLEIILSLPDQPLRHYTAKINQDRLEATIKKFRQSIVVRSRRDFYVPAQQLYDLLIRPISKDLIAYRIKTLVFVPDGTLRNIPLSALYDGQQYLIENYNLAITPGLQLLSPRPIERVKLNTIAAGITEARLGFAPLKYVDSELEKIENTVNSSIVLLNQNFTSQSLQEKIRFSDYPIVHIATHGQFSSSVEDTFLLSWNERININQLHDIVQTRNTEAEKAIELLVLSACETASGDQQAALGLAGMAVRAGARSTLASLWSVNDNATTKMMSNFYNQLSNQSLNKANALRQAQLSLLKEPGYEHPFYWAAYVLLGNWL